MNPTEVRAAMQITVTVSDELVREAGARGLPVIDFIETLIDKGFSAVRERPVLNNAMERIRALRSTAIGESMERKR
jgi:post-segregation antitoxin (ccd killing protein)